MQIHDLEDVTIPLREAPEMSDLESEQTSVDEQVHDPADATMTLDETPEASLLESEHEQASIDEVQIHDLNDTAPSVIEDAGMSDLEGEQASNDENSIRRPE